MIWLLTWLNRKEGMSGLVRTMMEMFKVTVLLKVKLILRRLWISRVDDFRSSSSRWLSLSRSCSWNCNSSLQTMAKGEIDLNKFDCQYLRLDTRVNLSS